MEYPIDENILYIFTDGASRSVFNKKSGKKSGRHGGTGIRFVYLDKKGNLITKDQSPYTSYTKATNQDMELGACIDGLKIACKENLNDFRKIIIVTDALYVYNNRKQAYFGNREWKSWKTVYGDPVVHKKQRKELNKYMKKISINVDFARVKGHKDNEYNNKADKSAVKGAQSLKRILWNNSGARQRFFRDKVKAKGFLDVKGQEVLIHIYHYRYLRKNRYRYNYEVVSDDSDFFMKTGWIFYERSTLSAEYIYLVKIKDDGSNQIENVIAQYTKDEIRDKMLNNGYPAEIFFGKKQ